MKIVFLDTATLGDISLEPISCLGEFTAYSTSTDDEAVERAADADVLIVNKIEVTENLLSRLPKLKLVCVAATGVNNIDLKAAAARNIPVKNVTAYSTDSVAQVCFTQILELTCKTTVFNKRIRDGIYSRSGIFTDQSISFRELAGRTMGVVGMGTIGSKVSRIAVAFGMNVVYYSTTGTNHNSDYPALSLEELLQCSDVVTIHCPLNENTRGLIGKEELGRMKTDAILINMARGGIVDEAALAEALDEGIIAGAAVDTFTKEPMPIDNPLMNMKHPERLRLTPHIAWASVEAQDRLVAGIADNIKSAIGWLPA